MFIFKLQLLLIFGEETLHSTKERVRELESFLIQLVCSPLQFSADSAPRIHWAYVRVGSGALLDTENGDDELLQAQTDFTSNKLL
jgi:hypothetical protein